MRIPLTFIEVKKSFIEIPRLKGHVLPGQNVFDQPNATDFVIHNIDSCPQLSRRHIGGKQPLLHFCMGGVAALAKRLAKSILF